VHTFSSLQNQTVYVNGAPVMQGVTTTIAAGGSNSSGLLEPDNSLTPGLSVGLVGSAAQITNLRAYPPGNPFIAVNVEPGPSALGPMHLLFNTPGNVYVRPSGFQVVLAAPPAISAIAPAGDGSGNIAIAGQQFTSSTQVWFDGFPGTIQSQSNNLLIVTPPPAPPGYTAPVAAFNSDGQSSLLFLTQGQTPPMYTFGSAATPSVSGNPSVIVRPGVIPAGGAVTLDVEGSGTNFQAGVTAVGFGTSDVTVGQVNVISSTHLTVSVTPNVTISSADITITTGLEVVSQAVNSQVTAADSSQ
jgi:hypothetical protein